MKKGLAWWMRAVGAFYILLGIRLVPAVNGGQVTAVTRVDPNAGTTFSALLDWMFLFGLEMAIIGGFLIVLSRRPLEHRWLVILVIVLEVIRGSAFDLYYVSRGYVFAGLYLPFSALHIVIAATGAILYARTRTLARERSNVD
jgi:BphX-like protein